MPLERVCEPAFYDAIYLPGGHGAMLDLPGNKHLADLLGEAFMRGGPGVQHPGFGAVFLCRSGSRPLSLQPAAHTPTPAAPARAGKVVAAVCHGPAGLLDALGPGGEPIISGRRVTGFTASEERAAGREGAVPFQLEERLGRMGGRFERGEVDGGEFALRDGNLVTGQNPASAERVASLAVEVLTAPAGSMPQEQ